MFQNLRKGSSVYVLDTRETPIFYTAAVKEVGVPYYPQPTPGQLTPFQQQYINITIENNEPWGVPVNLDVVSKDGLTVSMTREGLMPAITAAQKESSDIINSFERHKANLAAYDQILKDLDPSYAKAKAQDEEIKRLNNELSEIKSIIRSVPSLEDIKGLFDKQGTPKTAK